MTERARVGLVLGMAFRGAAAVSAQTVPETLTSAASVKRGAASSGTRPIPPPSGAGR